ncbi:hypothetical protein TNCV_928321 [Trichonephila clavipes]|nr:hypothetical protein TNCV_928321 [Trichonephila clavipes]
MRKTKTNISDHEQWVFPCRDGNSTKEALRCLLNAIAARSSIITPDSDAPANPVNKKQQKKQPKLKHLDGEEAMQQFLVKLEKWLTDWRIAINVDKNTSHCFQEMGRH